MTSCGEFVFLADVSRLSPRDYQQQERRGVNNLSSHFVKRLIMAMNVEAWMRLLYPWWGSEALDMMR